jgi:benzoylformate decarboxylase
LTTVREVTYQVLRDLGLTKIFGNPGSSELPFLKDMPADFEYVLGLHERAAAGIGLGYALGRNEAAFVNLHSIASAGNGLSTLIDAYYLHAPLVVTTGQQDRRQILAEPFLVSRAVDVVKPYVKWAYEPLRAEDVPAAIARGYQLAMQPPRGPVFISIPMDDWNKPCEPVVARRVSHNVEPDRAALDHVAGAIDASQNLALITGSQIEEDDAWNEVLALAERLHAAVYAEPIAPRWAFPHNHRLFRGGLLPAQKPLADQLSQYDTVVVLGAPVFLYYAYVPGDPIRPGTKLFQITNSPQDAVAAQAGTSIVGNIATAVRYLRERVKKREHKMAPQAGPADAKAEFPAMAGRPMTTAYLFSTLAKLMPHDSIIAEECPSSKGDLEKYVRLDKPGSFYSVRSGILGFGVPAAVGLQLARPERRVICAVGDGSLQYSVQALWTAVQTKAPVIFVVICNGNYSALKGFREFTNVGTNVPGIDIPGIDATLIARGYGMQARAVDGPEELEPALRDAFEVKCPSLVSVTVQPGGEKTMGMDQSVNPPNYG